MKDEKDILLDDLFRRARLMTPDTARSEEHFETRLMAAIEEKRNDKILWSVWAWRLVPWLTMLVIAIGIGGYSISSGGSGDPFSGVLSGDDDYQVSMLAGE